MTKHRIILGMQRQQQMACGEGLAGRRVELRSPGAEWNSRLVCASGEGAGARMGRAAHADLSLPSLRRCFVSQGGSSLSDGSRLSRNTEPTCA
ncbi:unnamed protein product [Lampetra fluviatilis]